MSVRSAANGFDVLASLGLDPIPHGLARDRRKHTSISDGDRDFIGWWLSKNDRAWVLGPYYSKVESLIFPQHEVTYCLEHCEHFRSWNQEKVAKSVQCGEPVQSKVA